MKKIFTKLFSYIIYIFFPKVCSCCGTTLSPCYSGNICSKCLIKLPKNEGLKCKVCDVKIDSQSHCYDCSHNKNYFDYVKAPYIYTGKMKLLIHKFKYSNRLFLAKDFSIAMTNVMLEYNWDKQINIIIPVPLFITRRFSRGYNQADLLAKQISIKTNIETNNKILKRNFYTKAQFLLNRTARKENLKNSFSINKKYINNIKNKNILLVDDIVTTCSTINACAKLLKKYGAKKIFVIAIARTSFLS